MVDDPTQGREPDHGPADPAGWPRDASGDQGAPGFDLDHRALITRSDLVHTGRIATGTQGLPIANGRFGGPVWQRDGATLVMQLNHTDVFMFNDASAVSQDHRDAGGGAVGRVHVGFGAPAVFDETTRHHLALYEGTLAITGAGVEAVVVADPDRDVIIVEITDRRRTPLPITVDLAMLREAHQVWGPHTALSTLVPAGPDGSIMVLEQRILEESDTDLPGNDHDVSTAVAITVQGRDRADVTGPVVTDVGGRTALRLGLAARTGTFTVVIGAAVSPDPNASSPRAEAVQLVATARDRPDLLARTRSWWAEFWQRSSVYLPTHPDFERRRAYYLYLAAISSRGAHPARYNGGLWAGEEDRRDWGSFYWNWNQDSLYQPLMAANHLELMEPTFRMRKAGYERYRVAARQMWGAEGIFIGETVGILGWETLPDEVAQALRSYTAFETAEPSAELIAFTARRNRYLTAWNWNVFDGAHPASFVTHTMMATQETAEHCWAAYGYTRDLDWLRAHGYPFIKGAAELYRTSGVLRRHEDGRYHVHDTNLHEHIWAGQDVIDDLVMARGVFAAVIKASELLGVDEAERAGWREIGDHLADYPLRSDPGALWAGTTDASLATRLATPEPAWAQGREPAHFVRDLHGTESPIFKMLEKYDLLNLETRDQGLDHGEWEIAHTTFEHSPGYLNQVTHQIEDRNGSSRFHVDAARLGRADDLAKILTTQHAVFSTYGEFPNQLFDQGDYYSAEGYATFAAALQEGLHQSLSPTPVGDPVIRVFPAWPRAWDATFRLQAKDGFLVSSAQEAGVIRYVQIESRLGEIARVRNPWDAAVVVRRDGVEAERLEAVRHDLLTLPTRPGETLVLVPADPVAPSPRTPHRAPPTVVAPD